MLRAAIGNKNFEMIFINCDLKIASNIQALHPAGIWKTSCPEL